MPSKNASQHRLMEAASHTKGGYDGVPQDVGQRFVLADMGRKFAPPQQSPPKKGKRK